MIPSRTLETLLASTLSLALVAAVHCIARADLDVSIGNNTKLTAELAPADEIQTYRVRLAAGSRLSATAKAKPEKKAAPVELSLLMLDGADQTVATGTPRGRSVRVRGFVAAEAGTYRIVVAGTGPETGAYELKVKWKPPRRVRDEIQVAEGGTLAFSTAPGTTATLKVKATKGSPALPRLAGVESKTDGFAFLDFAPPKESARSHRHKKLPLGSALSYCVTLDNAGAAGAVLVDLRLKAPRASKTKVDLRKAALDGGEVGASGGQPAVAFGGVFGPEGGAAQAHGTVAGVVAGAGISVPAGALSGPTAITFGAAVNALPPPEAELVVAGPTVYFGPPGLEFGVPATITIPLAPEALAGGVDSIVIFARDEDGTVTPIPPPYAFDLDAGTCSFAASHFTSFRAFAAPPDSGFENERVVIPNDAVSGDEVGRAVAIHGDLLVIGAPEQDVAQPGSGAAYVYVREGGSWVFEAKLVPFDATASADFGADVAIEGHFVAVGAPGAQQRGTVTGAVYVFARFQSEWAEFQKLVGSQSQNGDRFGASVDLRDSVLVAGAPGEEQPGDLEGAGAAYVFESIDGFLETQRLTQSSPATNERFGTAVALGSGRRVAVGAPGTLRAGRAFVFDRDPQGPFGEQWQETAELFHGQQAGEEDFGAAVDCDLDRVVVGDPTYDHGVEGRDAGQVYVFELAQSWELAASLSPPVTELGSRFGSSVSIFGDGLVVGQPQRDAPGIGAAGAAQFFERRDGTWTFLLERFADQPAVQDRFGTDVALGLNVLAVGAPGLTQTTGAAFVYDLERR